jgi:hypothetical protein
MMNVLEGVGTPPIGGGILRPLGVAVAEVEAEVEAEIIETIRMTETMGIDETIEITGGERRRRQGGE